MTHPVILDFGAIKLHSYGLFIFLGFALGTLLATRRAKAAGINPNLVMDLVVWVLISSLVGARLMYVLFHLREFQGRWLDIINPIQSDGTVGIAGLVILGGVIAAVPTAIWFLRRKNQPVLPMLDLLTPSLTLGIALGRLGCFLNGCCYGSPTELPWGVIFPATCLAGHQFTNEAIHPTQLYEVGYAAIFTLVLLIRSRTQRFTGELFYLFLVLYGIARPINESLRYYDDNMVLVNLGSFEFTVSMLISAAMITAGVVLLRKGYASAQGRK